MTSPVRVCISPSPTGYLDVGMARIAIFNWLFARQTGGKFLIRIEDSDVERSDASHIEPILNALKWLGLDWDENVVYQSQRAENYKKCAQALLAGGHAYRCFCTTAELEAEREAARAAKLPPRYSRICLRLSHDQIKARLDAGVPFGIRLQIPEGETAFNDIVSGEMRSKNDDIEDLLAANSDGSATCNFASVIDDHEMGVTHVIRGNDHLTNTLKQMHLYQALGWAVPEFGHVPPILNPDSQAISKRLGDKDIAAYKDEGILPNAMFNYLCLLGWSPKTEREIYSPKELVGIFDPHYVNLSTAVFDDEKLIAFNRAHIQLASDHDLAVLVAPMLVEAGVTSKYWLETRWEYLRQVISLLKERVRRVSDFVSLGGYFFSFEGNYDPEAAREQFNPESVDLLAALVERFEALPRFTHETTEGALELLAEERGLKKARLVHPTRLAVSGLSDGPGLYDLLVVLTRLVVIQRMKKAIEYIRRNHQIAPQG